MLIATKLKVRKSGGKFCWSKSVTEDEITDRGNYAPLPHKVFDFQTDTRMALGAMFFMSFLIENK